MKKIIFIFILLISTSLLLAQEMYHTNAIYVKYTDSKGAKLQSNSSQYTITPAFDLRRYNLGNQSRLADSLLYELGKIQKLKFNYPIDPVKMANLFAKKRGVEYAEPIPKSYIFANETNDPDLNQLYHLYLIKAFEAWNLMTGDTVLIGIVDTGIDFDHEDLKNQVWYNPGEQGKDEFGNDKSTNGIDDDNNGFVDDWRGWDFGSESGYDNDPSYGGDHGVHVSGIAAAQVNNNVGVAGVSPRAKILPVKIGPDFGLDNSVYNEFEGLLYAAMMGADVINCSWGSTGFSQSNALVVQTATEFGALIVAAAGNNNRNQAFYPASYEGVLSVASSADDDVRSGFSNYNTRVDISAPGTFIYSTVPDNKYDFKSGTSMASPVAAGAAAVLRSQFPDYTAQQIKSLIIVNTDNIDELNPGFEGLAGSGRLNLYKAITRENNIAINLKDDIIISDNPFGIINVASKVKLDLVFENVLDSIGNLQLIIGNDKYVKVEVDNTIFNFQNIPSGELFSIKDNIEITIPENTPENYNFNIVITAFHNGEKLQDFYVSFIANPSYLNLQNDEIAITVTSIGNHGYNDFSENIQGIGFQYKEATDLMFEGGFMMTQKGKEYVADGIRNRSSVKDRDFFSLEKISRKDFGNYSVINSRFTDKIEGAIGTFDSLALGIEVKSEAYLFNEDGLRNSILLRYILHNQNSFDMDSIYVGLFYDWDISEGGQNDVIVMDSVDRTGYAMIVDDNDAPVIGVHLHSDKTFNGYAIDNAAFQEEMGIYDGFSEAEKQMTMTSGIARLSSRPNKDGSMVISAGPLFIPAGKKTEVLFSINASNYEADISESVRKLDEKLKSFELQSKVEMIRPINIESLYPNPAANNKTVEAHISSQSLTEVVMKIYDYRGRVIVDLGTKRLIIGYNPIEFSTAGLSQGAYYFGVVKDGELFSYPFTVINE
ncbi:MAG: S8 family peptidase [Candidatus Kapaibacterium sp.]